MSKLFSRELELPVSGVSKRVTLRSVIRSKERLVLFEETGPGCILHWWLTYLGSWNEIRVSAHKLQIRVFYDNSRTPSVNVSLAEFFGILLQKNIYLMNNAAIKILPRNAFSSYFPIPFNKIRIELLNNSDHKTRIWFMANWHSYSKDTKLTPLRFQIIHEATSAEAAHFSFLMADFAGAGFVAGMVLAVREKDVSDAWYHCGGDLWLIDGETNPQAMRGIGGEDVFNMSFGSHEIQTQWMGASQSKETTENNSRLKEVVLYRIFGPDPVWFYTSAVIRFGSKANDYESVVYIYMKKTQSPNIITPNSWKLAGPFHCQSIQEFRTLEWANEPIKNWPACWKPDFGQYIHNGESRVFQLPILALTEHGWCDLTQHFRGIWKTNIGTQPVDVSAYALGKVTINQSGLHRILIGFDDWLTLWIDDEEVYTGRHDNGFAVAELFIDLPLKEVEIRVKLSNKDNLQWRLWTFSLTLSQALQRKII